MMKDWLASASTTLIGSMPHKDPRKAIDLIIREMAEIPVWPQLPVYPSEQMMIQYLEGMPGIRVRDNRLFVETDSAAFEQELYGFYEDYLALESGAKAIGDSRFKLGEECGKTFFQFLDSLLGDAARGAKAVKGQIVGPFTLLAGLKDQSDRALLYDERLQDVVAKHLAMKAKWQIEKLKSLGRPVILFLDEPALAGFGSSAFISVSAELVARIVNEVIDAAHQSGAMTGIHVCANTDWSLAFDSAVDIINFDAYNYFDKFALYKKQFSRFIEDGRIIAWGMTPTADATAIEQETAQHLADLWLGNVKELSSSRLTVERILSQSLFTPSCGCGSLPEQSAERVVLITRELGQIMQTLLLK